MELTLALISLAIHWFCGWRAVCDLIRLGDIRSKRADDAIGYTIGAFIFGVMFWVMVRVHERSNWRN